MGVLRPEGSLPPRVYWVRRAVVLLVLVAVVVLVVLGVRALLGGGGDDPAGTPDPTSPTTAATDGQSDAEAASTPACDAAALGVTLAADGTTYAAGALPTFTITLVNNGEQPCLVDAGEAQRPIVITSGSDRIWASTDCGGTDPMPLLLAPGEPDERQVQWDRNRSVEGCATGQAAALPGTYQAVLTLAGVTTDPAVFGLE